MTRPCTVVVNPVAGGYRPELIEQLSATLRTGGQRPQVRLTTAAGDAERFARAAAATGDPFIVACGGDGTIAETLAGIGPAPATLALIPLGTANVLAREIGISRIDEALAALARQVTRPLALGRAEAGGSQRPFALMAGIGFDGRVVAALRPGEKRRLGKGAYLLAALRCLARWESTPLSVAVDGRPLTCAGLIICNASRYGGGFLLAPAADLFTPSFQVVCVTAPGRSAYLRLTLAIVAGRGPRCRGVMVLPATTVSVTGSAPVQLDGDSWLPTPAIFTAEPSAIRLVVPE
jgi:diacylglycerol kinase family enzyme